MKDMIKGTDEKIQSVRFGKVPSAGASVPISWGVPPSWHVDVFNNLEAL